MSTQFYPYLSVDERLAPDFLRVNISRFYGLLYIYSILANDIKIAIYK